MINFNIKTYSFQLTGKRKINGGIKETVEFIRTLQNIPNK